MSLKRQREQLRRRANRLAQQAWEAAEAANFQLAVKIIRRAVELHPGNPVLWHDQGVLLMELGALDEAARSFEAAIQVGPDLAEAYARLATIRFRHGRPDQAIALAREAVRSAPASERYRAELAAYEALLAGGSGSLSRSPSERIAPSAHETTESSVADEMAARCRERDWSEIGSSVTEGGSAWLKQLLSASECAALRAMFHEDARFAQTVTMNKPRFGKGVYRYFARPLPAVVEALRESIYPHAARIANQWQRLLGESESYPPTWPEFQDRCVQAGQTTPSPILLRYQTGGFNALHQDVRGALCFPLQLVVVLSARWEASSNDAGAFSGGEFLVCDQPERRASDRRAIPAGLGDGVLFCTRARLVRIGGVCGLQPVRHGLATVTSGTRYALGVPFHDFS